MSGSPSADDEEFLEKKKDDVNNSKSPEKLTFPESFPQILACTIILSMWFAIGLGGGYSAILLPQLMHENSTLYLTKEEASWVAAILPLTTPLGAVFSASVIDIVGRKMANQLIAVPLITGWVLIASVPTHLALYVGRSLIGVAAGMVSSTVIHVTELAHPYWRAMLTSMPMMWTSFGSLVVYVLGATLHWRTVAAISSTFPALTCLGCIFLPDSPSWLLSRGREKDAESAVHWLYRRNPRMAESVLISLRKSQEESKTKLSQFERLKKFSEPRAYKPLLLLFTFFIFQQTSGCFITLFYTVNLFQEVGKGINAYTACVLVGLFRMVMTLAAVGLSRFYGRRPLSMVSGSGMAASMFVAGITLYCLGSESDIANWVSLVSVLVYISFSSIGFLSIPWAMSGELLPLDVRGLGGSICNAVNHLLMFGGIKVYPDMVIALGGYGVLLFFGVASALGVLFIYFFLPETFRRTLQDIENHFSRNNRRIENYSAPI